MLRRLGLQFLQLVQCCRLIYILDLDFPPLFSGLPSLLRISTGTFLTCMINRTSSERKVKRNNHVIITFRLSEIHLNRLPGNLGAIHGRDASLGLLASGESEECESSTRIEEVRDLSMLLSFILEFLQRRGFFYVVDEDFSSLLSGTWVTAAATSTFLA